MFTEEEKNELFKIVSDIFCFTAPEQLEWKFNIQAVEYIEDLVREKYSNGKLELD
jgi:hypothetical protein